MITFELPDPMPMEFIRLIPEQRNMINYLLAEGIVKSYALSADRSTLWMIMIAKSEFDILEYIAQIIFIGGRKDNKGIVLKSFAFSGAFKTFKDGTWHFKLPFGELFIQKPEEMLSINFVETDTKVVTYSDERLSINVLEWIYEHNIFRKEGNWNLNIKKIMLAENMIILTVDISSADPKIINSGGCFVACNTTDNGGTVYNEISTKQFDVLSEIEKIEKKNY